MNEEFLLLDSICSTLHIGKTTAYRLIQSGKLPAYKIGRKWQIRQDDFDRYLEKNYSTSKND